MDLSSQSPVTTTIPVSVLGPALGLVPQAPRVERFPSHTTKSRELIASSAAARWTDLVEGRLAIVGHSVNELEASLIVQLRPEAEANPCSPFAAAMIRRILTGCAQKVLAYESDIAASTASFRIGSTLRGFGLELTMRQAPLALAVLAASHAISTSWSPPGYHELATCKLDQLELRMPRPEVGLRRRVTSAEYDVLKAIVEGLSYREVGALLGRSPRTVANQLRSISTKVGVCGRLQFVNLAVELCLSRDL